MLSMCLLLCFVVFWILCCVVCEKIKNCYLQICQIPKYVTLFSSKSLMHNFFWKNETFIFVNELQVAITITNIRVKVKKGVRKGSANKSQ